MLGLAMIGTSALKRTASGICWVLAAAALATPAAANATGSKPRPKLIVLIVVDQMSSSLLDRHRSSMKSGFKRLLEDGYRFEGAVVDHAPTNSLPGHLSAASGAYPRRHGIVDNEWVESSNGRPSLRSGFDDPNCSPVKSVDVPGGEVSHMGAGRFEASTIVGWTLAADPRARFASVGTGGGVSILHAGQVKGPVLWFDTATGTYISSSCFLSALPDWAARFNREILPALMAEDWQLSLPATVAAAIPDDRSYENSGSDTVFPHRRPSERNRIPGWFNFTPGVDDATLDLAKAAVEGERLGGDEVTDILTIGLSSLDHIGHRFGPTSLEQADALSRMDHSLGAFFAFLDEEIGQGGWTLGLTADHGAPPAPEAAAAHHQAFRISQQQAEAAVRAVVAAGDRAGNDRNARQTAAAEAARRLGFVARVIATEELSSDPEPGERMVRLFAHSFRPARVSTHPLYAVDGRSVAEFGLIIVPPPGAVVDWATSIHGSPYDYDRKVEMMFFGAGVGAGTSQAEVRTIDLAPTLANFAGITPTAAVDGKILKIPTK